jgi:hypothetical protein
VILSKLEQGIPFYSTGSALKARPTVEKAIDRLSPRWAGYVQKHVLTFFEFSGF